MTGLDLARELALLGSASLDLDTGAPLGAVDPDKWRDLAQRMSAHTHIPDALQENFCERLGLSTTAYWLVMVCGASEVFPQVAQAMTVLNRDSVATLVTPMCFAQLLNAALGVPIAESLQAALAHAPVERVGLIERLDPHASRPLSHTPLRLRSQALQTLLSGKQHLLTGQEIDIHREEPSRSPCVERSFVELAESILSERTVLFVRTFSRRAARQLALDVASVRGERCYFVEVSRQLPPVEQLGALRASLVVLDAFHLRDVHVSMLSFVRQAMRYQPRLLVIAPWALRTDDFPALDAPLIDWRVAKRVWETLLGETVLSSSLARRFRISLEELRTAMKAVRYVRRGRHLDPETFGEAELAEQLREFGARRMSNYVLRLPTSPSTKSERVTKQFADVIAHYGRRNEERPFPMVGCLVGPVGSGKTAAASELAHILGCNLYRLDVARLVTYGHVLQFVEIIDEINAGHGILLLDDLETSLADPNVARRFCDWCSMWLPQLDGLMLLAAREASAIPEALKKFSRFEWRMRA